MDTINIIRGQCINNLAIDQMTNELLLLKTFSNNECALSLVCWVDFNGAKRE
jgi:hypothetical protein